MIRIHDESVMPCPHSYQRYSRYKNGITCQSWLLRGRWDGEGSCQVVVKDGGMVDDGGYDSEGWWVMVSVGSEGWWVMVSCGSEGWWVMVSGDSEG